MRYTKEERESITQEIVSQHITYRAAAEKYSVSLGCIESWVRNYRKEKGITTESRSDVKNHIHDFEQLTNLSKDELINEVIKARVGEERAKKGYEVKGGGQKKEFVSLSIKNTK